PVGGSGDGGEANFAVGGAAVGAGAVVVARHRGQGLDGGAGVDGEHGVGVLGPFVGAGGDEDATATGRSPGEPDGLAAGNAGVVWLAGLLGRHVRGRLRRPDREAGVEGRRQRLRVGEVV